MIIAITRLHYGKDYLKWVIKSTEGLADVHLCLYTQRSTFSHSTNQPNPDTRAELREIAYEVGGTRLDWQEGRLVSVLTAFELYPDADFVIELDADEVLSPELKRDIKQRHNRGELTADIYRLPFLHFWRSWKYACKDQSWPTRIFYKPPNQERDIKYWPGGEEAGYMYHFGYARRDPDMQYKLALSEHKDEFRDGWWEKIYKQFPYRMDDLHPVCLDGFWKAESVNGKVTFPEWMQDHPYKDLEIIE